MDEHRHHQRTNIDIAVEFAVAAPAQKGPLSRAEAPRKGRAKDLSLGGMFVETDEALPFSTEIVVNVALRSAKAPLVLRAVVRWTGKKGMGIQFGPMGARETHAITEATRDDDR